MAAVILAALIATVLAVATGAPAVTTMAPVPSLVMAPATGEMLGFIYIFVFRINVLLCTLFRCIKHDSL